ncbi:PREDICTED: olfactory receptor 52D1-like [Nanorana parkeri]|uniref:olfactory receptor 52D1-like n=1 Tax=Nanorana parkeri TaxID=125878 RepID=UPI00085433AE|nr:PREDICTED: olfactory receptor 52D1-like [Nanorana parkeri]
MQNVTSGHPTVLFLSFGDMLSTRYIYSVIACFVYGLIVLFNGSVISAVALHKSLQEPMYIFIGVLCVNGLYGSASFFPGLIVQLFFSIETVSYIGCVIQVYCIHTYLGCEMTLLTAMAYDRYVCICNPLRYNHIMSLNTVLKLVAAAWSYTIVLVSIHIVLTIRLPLCDNIILKIYCDNWSIVRLACVDTTVNNGFGLFIASTFIALMPMLIICSYIKILKACARSSKDFQAKALQTCTPHLITITNFVCNLFFELLVYRFIPTEFPYELRVVMSVQVLVVPPILNPLIYGLKLKDIRVKILYIFHLRESKVHGNQL